MKTSDQGIALLKKHEGLRLSAYPDPATGGEPWTIGYGTTSRAGVGKVTKGMKITEAEAEDMLRRALVVFERGVVKALTRPPNQNQFDALVSFAYNVGVPAMSRSSVVRHFNNGDVEKAANSFAAWNKAAGKVMPGLTRRRAEERALFLKPARPRVAAPAPKPAVPNDEPILRAPAEPAAPEKAPSHGIGRAVILGIGAVFAAIIAIFFGAN